MSMNGEPPCISIAAVPDCICNRDKLLPSVEVIASELLAVIKPEVWIVPSVVLRTPTPRPPIKYPLPATPIVVDGLDVPIPTFPLAFHIPEPGKYALPETVSAVVEA